MKLKKIIIIYPSFERGGIENILVNLINELVNKKVLIEIITVSDKLKLGPWDNVNNNGDIIGFVKISESSTGETKTRIGRFSSDFNSQSVWYNATNADTTTLSILLTEGGNGFNHGAKMITDEYTINNRNTNITDEWGLQFPSRDSLADSHTIDIFIGFNNDWNMNMAPTTT